MTSGALAGKNLKGVAAVDLRDGFAGVFDLSSFMAAAGRDFRAKGVLSFSLLEADPEKIGLKTLGDFNLSFSLLVTVLLAGWKNGFGAGEPKTNVDDLVMVVTVGLKVTSAGLPRLFLFSPVDFLAKEFLFPSPPCSYLPQS